MKRIIAVLMIVLVALSLAGCNQTKERMSIITYVQGETLYVTNLNGVKNEGEWTSINLYEDVHNTFISEALEMDFKPGDLISFHGNGWGGWSDIDSIIIIARSPE